MAEAYHRTDGLEELLPSFVAPQNGSASLIGVQAPTTTRVHRMGRLAKAALK